MFNIFLGLDALVVHSCDDLGALLGGLGGFEEGQGGIGRLLDGLSVGGGSLIFGRLGIRKLLHQLNFIHLDRGLDRHGQNLGGGIQARKTTLRIFQGLRGFGTASIYLSRSLILVQRDFLKNGIE